MAETLEKTEDKPEAKAEGTEDKQSWKEEIEVAGDKLMAEIRRLARDAKVQRVRVIEPDGDVAVDIPLTVGALAGGALVLAAPALAIIGAVAAFATKVKVQIVREEEKADETS